MEIDNKRRATPSPGPDMDPRAPIWVPGLGALVLLDYRTGHDPHHLEHSVVFLPSEWETLYDLMVAPQAFANRVLRSYSEVKGYNAATQHVDLTIDQWPLAGPVTVHIEPLTSPSFQNLAVLKALSTLYPGFAGLTSMPSEADLGSTLASFRDQVITAATVPASPSAVAAAGAAYDKYVAGLIVPTKRRGKGVPGKGNSKGALFGGSVSGSGSGTTTVSVSVPQPAPFDLQYVVEFALDTRLVTVRYIPRTSDYSTSDPMPQHYDRPITPVTKNPVKYLGFEFLHFDLDMSDVSDYHMDMAQRRASFAMDFIENPLRLNEFLNNVDTGAVTSGSPTKKYMIMTDELTGTGNPLHQKVGGELNKVQVSWPPHRDPVIILESVLPDPSLADSGLQLPADNPTPCVIVVIVDGVPVYIVIKNYTS